MRGRLETDAAQGEERDRDIKVDEGELSQDFQQKDIHKRHQGLVVSSVLE